MSDFTYCNRNYEISMKFKKKNLKSLDSQS